MITRRTLLQKVGVTAVVGLPTLRLGGQTTPQAVSQPLVGAALTHQQFLAALAQYAQRRNYGDFLRRFRALMAETAAGCVQENQSWIVPSKAYKDCYARDSFWIGAALNNGPLSSAVLQRFADDQQGHPDGHIATALMGKELNPFILDRDEESTMMFVLHSFLLARLGGSPHLDALARARDFILAHVVADRYVTQGEQRAGPEFGGTSQLGTYHYWADTFRPAGRAEATPEVIAYNQGLLCVTLRALAEMGVPVDESARMRAEAVYAGMVNPEDGWSLPQREHSTIVDVSALVGEALSLYLWDETILGAARVQATLNRFAAVFYPGGTFLGWKVISDFYGGFRPQNEWSGSPFATPGRYHNGGSWFLYDVLALYVGARHGIVGVLERLVQRLQSEVRLSWASHEYLSTHPKSLGVSDPYRTGYGWNAFVVNLIPPPPV